MGETTDVRQLLAVNIFSLSVEFIPTSVSPRHSQKHRITKFLRHVQGIINNNIFDNIIQQQQKIDAATYSPVKLTPDNPSLLVIIHKKKTHMELAQHLHSACFLPVKSTFIEAIKNCLAHGQV